MLPHELLWHHEARRLRGIGFLLGLCLALIIPNLGLPQGITGPLVNALLLGAAVWLGREQALLLGLITPLSAVLRGVLPLPLWVMIPFIALGNATLVSVYSALRSRGHWLALGAAALAKCALLSAAVTWLTLRPLSLAIGGAPQMVALPASLVNMMRWPQLATALAGGALLWLIERGVQRRA